MTLCEFFELYESAPFAQAFATVRQQFQRSVAASPVATPSPWTLRLGKGGPKADGSGYYPGSEQSLYRHCMEVSVLAAWLFYHAWQAERPPLTGATEPVAALRTLLAIAFAHDADKLLGTPSKSPRLAEVQAVYELLSMDDWSGLSAGELHHAVSLVENRGQGQALFGTARIEPLTGKLAELVHTADNLLSRVAREGGTAAAFVKVFNEDVARLHSLYAVPATTLRLLRFHHQPIVLYRLQHLLGREIFDEYDFYPLLFVRHGAWLEVSVNATMDDTVVATWLDHFETRLAGREPSLKVAPTTGVVTWFDIGAADDLIAAVRDNPRQAQLLLRVTAKDWEMVAPLVRFWVMQAGAPFSTTPLKGKLCPVLKADGEIPDDHPFWRAACLAALPDRAATDRLLAVQQDTVAAGLQRNGIVPAALDNLSLRTVAALQASLLITSDLSDLLDSVQGGWPRLTTADPGVQAIVQRLRDQLAVSEPSEPSAGPVSGYAPATQGGTCLICGVPTTQVIESSRMKLAGVKASSFSNRIGHEKHLWSEKGENYVCPSCLAVQGLLLNHYPSLRSTPLLIATPVRHLLETRTDTSQQNVLHVLRSFDAIAKEGWQRVLPWQRDASYDEPLLFEERVTALAEVIDQIHRLARYAALSGEPVHVLITNQRECKAAFLYEGMPELLKELFHDLMGEEGGISRVWLIRLIDRLDLFKILLAQYEGMTGLQGLPRFGWWATAFVLLRALDRAADRDKGKLTTRFLNLIDFARQEYPMSDYDTYLDALVAQAAETHSPRWDASGAEWTLMPRIALETYQKHYAFGPVATQDAITERLRADLSRRYGTDLYKKDLDDRLQAFAAAAFGLLAKAHQEFDLESGFIRFFLAAYEGGLRRTLRERWKNRGVAADKETAAESVTQSSVDL